MSGWQDHARALWGDEWIAPMSEVLDINRRTIERWRRGDGAPADVIQRSLARIAQRPDPHLIGDVLRRLARGETCDDIAEDYAARRAALQRVRDMLGKYHSIPVLALGR